MLLKLKYMKSKIFILGILFLVSVNLKAIETYPIRKVPNCNNRDQGDYMAKSMRVSYYNLFW